MNEILIKELLRTWRKTFQLYKTNFKPILLEHNLSKVDAKVIMILKKKDTKTKAELAKLLNFDPSSLTRSLDRLVDRKLLCRHEDKNDKRYIRIKLTDEGEQLMEIVRKKTFEIWKIASMDSSESELISFVQTLKRFEKNLANI